VGAIRGVDRCRLGMIARVDGFPCAVLIIPLRLRGNQFLAATGPPVLAATSLRSATGLLGRPRMALTAT
jgi:hypothetical protein